MRYLKMAVAVFAVVAMGICMVQPASAKGAKGAKSPEELGEKLVRDLFANMKSGKWDEIEGMMEQGFQSVHEDGARDAKKEMETLRGLNLGEYKLSDFVVTYYGQTIVVTYYVDAEETIDGKKLSASKTPRMSIFVKERMRKEHMKGPEGEGHGKPPMDGEAKMEHKKDKKDKMDFMKRMLESKWLWLAHANLIPLK